MGISLDKVEQKAPGLLSLTKSAGLALEKQGLNYAKAKVALVVDYSGSMRNQYKSGVIQRLAEKVLALGFKLDDDGEIDFFVFDSGAAHLGEINIDNYQGAVDRLTAGRHMGTTNYAAAFRAVQSHYGFNGTKTVEKRGLFGKKTVTVPNTDQGPASEPVFAIFLTDGAPDSKPEAVKVLTEVASTPIFWKFFSIGPKIEFLQKLDDLEDRFVDNADYQPVSDIDTISEEKLYDLFLEEYKDWANLVRQKGLTR